MENLLARLLVGEARLVVGGHDTAPRPRSDLAAKIRLFAFAHLARPAVCLPIATSLRKEVG